MTDSASTLGRYSHDQLHDHLQRSHALTPDTLGGADLARLDEMHRFDHSADTGNMLDHDHTEDRSAGRWCAICNQHGSHHTDRHDKHVTVLTAKPTLDKRTLKDTARAVQQVTDLPYASAVQVVRDSRVDLLGPVAADGVVALINDMTDLHRPAEARSVAALLEVAGVFAEPYEHEVELTAYQRDYVASPVGDGGNWALVCHDGPNAGVEHMWKRLDASEPNPAKVARTILSVLDPQTDQARPNCATVTVTPEEQAALARYVGLRSLAVTTFPTEVTVDDGDQVLLWASRDDQAELYELLRDRAGAPVAVVHQQNGTLSLLVGDATQVTITPR